MKPPLDLPAADPDKPGFYELAVLEGSTDPPVHYLVQLPPEYDPHRRYPAIVTLHGAGTTRKIRSTGGPARRKRRPRARARLPAAAIS